VLFLIDADLPRDLVELFETAGHEAIHADHVHLGAAPDESIAAFAKTSRRCLVTGDFDFSDIRLFPPREYWGIVVLVIPYGVTGAYIRQLVTEFLDRNADVDMKGKLEIVEVGRIRVRT